MQPITITIGEKPVVLTPTTYIPLGRQTLQIALRLGHPLPPDPQTGDLLINAQCLEQLATEVVEGKKNATRNKVLGLIVTAAMLAIVVGGILAIMGIITLPGSAIGIGIAAGVAYLAMSIASNYKADFYSGSGNGTNYAMPFLWLIVTALGPIAALNYTLVKQPYELKRTERNESYLRSNLPDQIKYTGSSMEKIITYFQGPVNELMGKIDEEMQEIEECLKTLRMLSIPTIDGETEFKGKIEVLKNVKQKLLSAIEHYSHLFV